MPKKAKSKVGSAVKAGATRLAKRTEKSQKQDRKQSSKPAEIGWQGDLERSLAALGLKVKAVAADGNCFFRACSDQLQGEEAMHMELRQSVVNFIEGHPADFSPYMEDDEDFESYCKRMRKDGTWAGLHEQVAVARLHGVELRIYQAGQPCWTVHPDFPEISEGAPAWHLSYHDGEHYNSVRLADDKGPGAPARIPVLDGRVAAPAEARAAACEREAQGARLVALGTGCEDATAICRALADAGGSVDEAIELLIERLAQDAATDPGVLKEDIDSENCKPSGQRETGRERADGSPSVAASSAVAEQDADGGPAQPVSDRPAENVSEPPTGREDSAKRPGASPSADQNVQSSTRDGKKALPGRPPPRNRPCTCGSGRRYKDCCGARGAKAERAGARVADVDLSRQLSSLYI